MHKSIFRRDVVIAVLLSWITSILLEQDIIVAISLTFPMLLMIFGVEEFIDKVLENIHLRRFIKKLRNRKVLPPTKARQD